MELFAQLRVIKPRFPRADERVALPPCRALVLVDPGNLPVVAGIDRFLQVAF